MPDFDLGLKLLMKQQHKDSEQKEFFAESMRKQYFGKLYTLFKDSV